MVSKQKHSIWLFDSCFPVNALIAVTSLTKYMKKSSHSKIVYWEAVLEYFRHERVHFKARKFQVVGLLLYQQLLYHQCFPNDFVKVFITALTGCISLFACMEKELDSWQYELITRKQIHEVQQTLELILLTSNMIFPSWHWP